MEKVTSHPYNFQLIPAAQINVNRLYQRDANRSVIKTIVNNFDYRLVNPVKVVWNHNEWYAFDGQHTATSLRAKFGDDYLVPCLVYEDVDGWFEEAKLFEDGNKRSSHKALPIIVEWKSRLFRGEEKAVKIKKVCERYGLKILIGRENVVKVMDNSTLIFKSIIQNGTPVGAIGIIGPTRMDYRRVIATVDSLAKGVSAALDSGRGPKKISGSGPGGKDG